MLKKLLYCLILCSLPLQGIVQAVPSKQVPVLTANMVKAAHAEICKEIAAAQRTTKLARFGLFGSAGTGLSYMAYRYFFAGAVNNVPQIAPIVPVNIPQNQDFNQTAGQILTEQRQFRQQTEQRFDRIEQAAGLDPNQNYVASGAISLGKQLLNILLISAGVSAAYYCASKIFGLIKATTPYFTFSAFVEHEQFLQYCLDLKVRAEEVRITHFVSRPEFDAFMHMHGLLIQKLARLCGYLTIRASKMQNTQPGVAAQLQNTVGAIIHRSTALAERLEKNPGMSESAHAVFDFIVVMENVIKQAKHIEAMAMG